MVLFRPLAVLVPLLGLVAWQGCSSQDRPQHSLSPTARASQAAEKLANLFEVSDRQEMALDPIGALIRGEQKHAAEFGDYITQDYLAAKQAKVRADLERLREIDPDDLARERAISYRAFEYRLELQIKGFESGAEQTLRHLPLDQLFGFHVIFPDMSSGESIAPFRTLQDYENGLSRLEGFVTYLGRAQKAMEAGIAAGHVLPRFAAQKVIDQVSAAVEEGIEGSPFLKPTRNFPPSFRTAEKTRLAAAFRSKIQREVLPAYRALHEFLDRVYLPASRSGSPGLSAMKDGDELYAFLIERHTSTRMSPESIHQLGLEEVARIRGEMEKIRKRVGFEGSLSEFFDFQRTDPQFKFATEGSLIAAYEAVWDQVEPQMESFFERLPAGAFEIRPVPESLAKTSGGAYYYAGTPDGSRPGVFYINTYDLPSRISPVVETLFLHEAMPGHHLQGSLALEDATLPGFQRFGDNTAYGEGWALYVESLGPELGLFTDPYQLFGHLDLEMFRALRLVVDSGLHTKGWSRERAVEYMLANSSWGESTISAEVDRYLVWPAQALAYKLGQLTIRRLRSESEAAFGEKFDVRAFHSQILGSG
nr:DUF885 domain-containing protein [Deltaproteobacteria bacterium]